MGVCSVASYIAALMGYAVGYNILRCECVNARFQELQQKYPTVEDLMRSKGACGVAMAALLPIPLALATWTAGAMKVSLPPFLLAGMCRMPKIAVFVILSRGPQAKEGAT